MRYNLNRLEDRFRARYYSSVQKDLKRRQKGKISHKTTLQSIEENRKRFEQVRIIRHQMLGDPLILSMKKQGKC